MKPINCAHFELIVTETRIFKWVLQYEGKETALSKICQFKGGT